jgi:uncharacterized membrane protein YqiK
MNMAYLVAKAAVAQAVREKGSIDSLVEDGKKEARRKKEFAEGTKKMRGNLVKEMP